MVLNQDMIFHLSYCNLSYDKKSIIPMDYSVHVQDNDYIII
jgi:hypothetical protein